MRIRKLFDDLYSGLWFRPTLWVLALGTLALIVIYGDRSLSQTMIGHQLPLLFVSEADGARTMLGAISSAMLTVTTLAFSIIMLAVTQTANAYSPRLLRLYLADTANQHLLGILIGTFLFSLLVLRVVRVMDGVTFIPVISVTIAILLSLLSIGAFIYFIHHVAHSIEVDNIITLIMREAEELLEDLFPGMIGQPWPEEIPPVLTTDTPAIITAQDSGYIQFIAPEELLEVATKAGVVVRLESITGDYVLLGTPLASIWPATALNEILAEAVQQAFQLGEERTLVQDLLFGVRQLSDIALRAISPAVNDPSTAVNCIDALGTLLVQMARLEPVSPYRCDAGGKLRLIVHGATFEAMLDLAFNQIRQYAARDFACTLRLIEVCTQLAYVARQPSRREALWRHISMVARSAGRHFVEPGDRAEVNKRLTVAADVLKQDGRPLLLAIEY